MSSTVSPPKGTGSRRQCMTSSAGGILSTAAIFDGARLKAADTQLSCRAAQFAEADAEPLAILRTAMKLYDASHLTKPNQSEGNDRIFEQMLSGHEHAFSAVAESWQETGGFDALAETGAVDPELAAQLAAEMSSPHAASSLLRTTASQNDSISSNILLLNTMRTGPSNALHYVAVVRYSPSAADEKLGLQPMWCTYLASASGVGPGLLYWLNEAMHGSESAHEHLPVTWRLADVNFARHGLPERSSMLGATKPLVDSAAAIVAAIVAFAAIVAGARAGSRRGASARAAQPSQLPAGASKLVAERAGWERERGVRSSMYWR